MRDLTEEFWVASGSVIGREHVRLGRNNQDGAAVWAAGDCLVGVVTDGCSSGRCNEVGARLGAAWLARWTPVCMASGDEPGKLCKTLAQGLADYLERVGSGLQPDSSSWSSTVNDFLLFTFLVAAVDRERALIFGLGDGVFSVNGSGAVLDSGPGNAPDYVGYRLVGLALEPKLHFAGATDALESLLIGTDGAAELPELEAFEADARYGRNPSLLQKRLNVLGEREARPRDDATLIALGRRGGLR